MAMRSARDQPDEANQRAQSQKSSKALCLFANRPASCHDRPYSPPPLSTATARIPPRSTNRASLLMNEGVMAMSKPPYPTSRAGASPVGATSRRRVRNSGTAVPSSAVTKTCSLTRASASTGAAGPSSSRVSPVLTSWDHSEPESMNEHRPKCTKELSARPSIPIPSSPVRRETMGGRGSSRTWAPSSSRTDRRERAS